MGSAADELGVTAGAISQQLKLLEDHLGLTLIAKDGRRATLTPEATVYHSFTARGFEQLELAQDYIVSCRSSVELTISGLPSLLLKWLNPNLHRFQASVGEQPVRLDATRSEPDPRMLDRMFRLTYGLASRRYAHSRILFTDVCFPVCAPQFLESHPEARDPAGLAKLPLIEIDWGRAYSNVPHWKDWFALEGVAAPQDSRPLAVYSLSSLALEAAAGGLGVTLAQASFAAVDIELGRLIRLSPKVIPMPEPYFVCWGPLTLEHEIAREFLNWLMLEARPLRTATIEQG